MNMETSSGPGTRATVFVIDDDDANRGSVEFLLASVGLRCRSFRSPLEFLDTLDDPQRGCLLLDVRMPEMGGLDLLRELRRRDMRIPAIMMTAFADVATAVRAFRLGAFHFIEKPIDERRLLHLVRAAFVHEQEQWLQWTRVHTVEARLARLSHREREVMLLIVQGLLNKQIAGELDISIKTVEKHRAQVMVKMEAGSLAHLVRMTSVSKYINQLLPLEGQRPLPATINI